MKLCLNSKRKMVLLGLLAALGTSCGKSNSNKQGAAQQPESETEASTLETKLASISKDTKDGVHRAHLAFTANQDGARILCTIKKISKDDPTQETVISVDQLCPQVLPMDAGNNYKISAHASLGDVVEESRKDFFLEGPDFIDTSVVEVLPPAPVEVPVVEVVQEVVPAYPSDPAPSGDIWALGRKYDVRIPAGMHVTQYATNQTSNGKISMLQKKLDANDCSLSNTTSKYYSSTGRELDYCTASVNERRFERFSQDHYTQNHIEMSTDNSSFDSDLPETLILFQAFDSKREYNQTMSRFSHLCGPQNQISFLEGVTGIPVAEGFWFGEFVGGKIETCDAEIVEKNKTTRKPHKIARAVLGSRRDGDKLEIIFMQKMTAENAQGYKFINQVSRGLVDILSEAHPF